VSNEAVLVRPDEQMIFFEVLGTESLRFGALTEDNVQFFLTEFKKALSVEGYSI
jgi:hypothetical protein